MSHIVDILDCENKITFKFKDNSRAIRPSLHIVLL